jgi:DNA-binding beta-propeller fold protein YncE
VQSDASKCRSAPFLFLISALFFLFNRITCMFRKITTKKSFRSLIWLTVTLSLTACGKADSLRINLKIPGTSSLTAPEFPAGLDWLNTDHPLKLKELQGKIILLDFWTYCCINCIHIIPDLKRLEAEYPNELIVIGVHSAKFTEEGQTENIRQAIMRYQIEHPVINDRNFAVWQSYGAQAWPTVVLIDPNGKIASTHSGEGVYASFREPIRNMISEFDAKGSLNRQPLNLSLESTKEDEHYLAYPGKVLADPDGGRLFISDQNHNRIVVCKLVDGEITDLIGSGDSGFQDGSFNDAMFNHPQGMALVRDKLYIADTENHVVREVDLTTREVATLSGNGKQASGWALNGGIGKDVSLSSPWDLAYRDGMLYVAMAGTHQIWIIRLADGYAAPFAGSGREGLQDGDKARAALAQPSGLIILGDRLYFADSEVSAIRYVELTSGGRVGTIVGEDLFEFGDSDGKGDEVRLQHPLGVTTDGNLLYVADTYNNKIKVIDPNPQICSNYCGNVGGFRDGDFKQAQFYEPGGICYTKGKLYIADTNNHRIRVIDLNSSEVTTLDVHGAAEVTNIDSLVTLPQQRCAKGPVKIHIMLNLPVGAHLNQESDVNIQLFQNAGVLSANPSNYSFPASGGNAFDVPVVLTVGKTNLSINIEYTYCTDSNTALCYRGHSRTSIPVLVEDSAIADSIDIVLQP